MAITLKIDGKLVTVESIEGIDPLSIDQKDLLKRIQQKEKELDQTNKRLGKIARGAKPTKRTR